MKAPAIIMYHSFYEPVKDLSLEDKGRLFDAIFNYHIYDVVETLPQHLNIAFSFMKYQFDMNSQKYDAICERNRKNGLKGGRKGKNPDEAKKPSGLYGNPKNPDEANNNNNNNNNLNEEGIKKKTNRFSPPSLTEIQNYFSEVITKKGLGYDPVDLGESFHDYFQSNGWVVGKAKAKMVDWKAAVRNWLKNQKPINGSKTDYCQPENMI